MDQTPKLLTVTEFAGRLGLKPCTVRKWIYARRLGVVRLGRAVRLRESDAEKLVRENYQPPL